MEVLKFCWRSTTDLETRGFACKDSTARIAQKRMEKCPTANDFSPRARILNITKGMWSLVGIAC